MSRRRKIGLISTAAGLGLVVGGSHAATAPTSLAGIAILMLAMAAAAAFALSFLCLQRPFTLVLWLCTATIGGIALESARHQSVAGWQFFWSLELLGLAAGLVGFTLTYIRGEDEGVGVAAFRGAPL